MRAAAIKKEGVNIPITMVKINYTPPTHVIHGRLHTVNYTVNYTVNAYYTVNHLSWWLANTDNWFTHTGEALSSVLGAIAPPTVSECNGTLYR